MTCWKWVTSTGHCYGEIVKTIRNIDLLWTGTAVGGKRHIPQLHSRSKVYLGFAQWRSPKRLRFILLFMQFLYFCKWTVTTLFNLLPSSSKLLPLIRRSGVRNPSTSDFAYTTASKLNIKCMKIKNYREEICLLQYFKRGTEDSLHNII